MDALKYRDILQNHMLPYAEGKLAAEWIFQQDNDPKHTSLLVKDWLQKKNINVLPWPSQSPDLNPIEHLWDEIDRRLRTKKYGNLNELMCAIESEWQKIPIERLQTLIDSMPHRCQAVIKAKGFATRY